MWTKSVRSYRQLIDLRVIKLRKISCYRRSWNCCDRRARFVVIWKHFCFILSTGTKIRIDSVMRPRSSSSGCNTSASVTVTVTHIFQNRIHLRIASFIHRGVRHGFRPPGARFSKHCKIFLMFVVIVRFSKKVFCKSARYDFLKFS